MRKLTTLIILLSVFIMAPSIANAITVSISNVAQNENNGNMTFTVIITDDTVSGNAKFNYATVDGTATTGDNDYTTDTGTVMFNNGDPVGETRTFDVPITGDTKVEADETFTVTLTPQDPGDFVTGSPATGTINNDDSATVSIAANDPAATEPGGAGNDGQFTVSISDQSDTDTVINITVSGDATEGSDYGAIGATVTIPANTSSALIDVSVINENLVEDNETVTVTLDSFASGYAQITIGASNSDTVTISDDDNATVSIAANDPAAAEPANDGQFTVTMTNPSDTNTVISYNVTGDAAAGSDYTALSGSVTVLANATTATIDVAVIDENLVEDNETVTVTLNAITSGDADIFIDLANDDDTVTISDDDSATVSIAANDAAAAEPANDGQFTVTMTNPSDTNTVISYNVTGDAIADTDYTALSGSVTILANATTATIDVAVIDDNPVEDNETVIVILNAITSGDADISIDLANDDDTVTIADDDTATFTINDQTVNEDAGTMTFTVSLDNSLDIAVDVDVIYADVSATGGGTDYDSATDQVTFPAGDTADKTVTVAITNDNIVEGTETFTASLSAATPLGGRSTDFSDTGTGTITNDDAATLTIAGVTLNEGSGGGTTDFDFTVTLDNAVQDGLTVVYTTDDGTATVADGDYTDNDSSLNFAGTAGESHTITVAVSADGVVEPDEAFTVALGAVTPVSADAGDITKAGSPATGAITNDDRYQITIDDPTVAEDAGNVTFTVSISPALQTGDTVTVDYATANGTAVAGSDYTTASGTVTINTAGATTGTFTVPIINDIAVENVETFVVNLSNSTPAAFTNISDPQGQCTINDNDYTLTISKTGNGTVTSAPAGITCGGDCSETFEDSQSITLTAVADAGWDFLGWQGDTTGFLPDTISATVTFTMGSTDRNVTAVFGRTLTISKFGNGTVTSVPAGINCGATCSADFAQTDNITLTATPDAGWAFIEWQGDTTGFSDTTSPTVIFTMGTSDRNVTAVFGRTLTISKTGSGTVTSAPAGIDCGADCDEVYLEAEIITLNAVADAGWHFLRWEGDTAGFSGTTVFNPTFTMGTSARDVTAVFGRTLTISKTGSGTVTSAPAGIDCGADCDENYDENQVITLTATPDAGWDFIRWEGDTTGFSTTTASPTTFTMGTSDRNVTAVFGRTLTILKNGNGTVTSAPPGINCGATCMAEFDENEVITLTAAPDAGWHFMRWEGDIAGFDTTTATPATFTMGTSARDVTVVFGHTVVFTAGSNGSLSGTTIQTVEHGSDCTPVHAIPDPGYYFAGWSGGYGTENPLTITNVLSDMSIQAYFYSNKNCVWVDQSVNGGQFNYLGTFNLNAGSGTTVTLTNQDDSRTTCADAVWFHKTDGSDDVYIDNYDPGYTEIGTWHNSSSPDPYGGLARYSDDAATPGMATYNPTLAGGTYDVYAYWNNFSGRTRNVPYCILNFTGHVIRASAGANGTMTVSINAGPAMGISGSTVFTVNSGSDLTFDIMPDDSAGYVIEYLKVDGQYINRYDGWSGATSYTLSYVTSDHTVDVRFDFGETTESCFEVDQTKNAGKWNYLATLELPAGQVAYVTLTRESGDGTSTSADALRFVKTSDGTEIIVDNEGTFDEDGYFTPSGPNFITTGTWIRSAGNKWYGPNPPKSIYSSTTGDTATWIPDLPSSAQYDIYAWWTKSGSRARHAPYCVYNHAGKTIKATAGPHGCLVLSGVTVGPDESYTFTVDSGTTHTFTISAETGYQIQEVVVDGVAAEGDCVPPVITGVTNTTYTFSNVNESHRIRVSFEDHGDDCDTATPLNCNSSANGYISAGDKDYFRMDIGSGILKVWTTDQAGDLDPGTDTFGYLLGEDCDLFNPIETDDNSGSGFNFQIEKEVAAGTYYIVVGHSDAMSGEGSYALHVECTHIIRATAYSGGEIDPEGDIIVEHGGTTTFTITPDGINTIENVLVDSLSIGGVSTYTFFSVTSNHTILAQFSLPPSTCNDISDQTMNTMMVGVPANIMFMLDDSGSMDWEFMTDEGNGLFGGNYYPFDNPGDNAYPGLGHVLTGEERGLWMSQWSGYNAMYYNPKTTYTPWPDWHPTLENADLDNPRSHPRHATPTFDLNADYYSIPDIGYPVDNEGSFSGTLFVPSGATFTVLGGAWRRSSGSPWYGPDPPRSLYTRDLGATGTWTTTLPTGDYNVYAWWTSMSSRATNAPYTINYYDGGILTDEVRVNQRAHGGRWNLLDTYHFDSGTPASVSIERENDNDNTCADAVCFIPVGITDIDIPNAHYYTWADTDGNGAQDSGETVYLVNLTKSGTTYAIEYYVVDVSEDLVWAGDLTSVAEASVPDSVKPRKVGGTLRSPTEERQNFANWYSFYRKREQTAMAAVARVIDQVDGVQIGFKSIHNRLHQPVLKINVDGVDERDTLLSVLYDGYTSSGGTPLRRGLQSVGQYYDQEDGTVNGGIGDSPYEANGEGGECQQCFAIVMTDGFWNGGAPDVDNEDGDEDTLFDGQPYGDTYAKTLADVAMYYYENDLASLLDDEIPDNPHDNAEHQHMVTYGVSFGVTGTLNPDDYDLTSGDTTFHPTWPHVIPDQRTTLDDLWHASVNGRGMFLSAKNPEELINSLLEIMENIAARTGSASSVSINGDELYDMVGADIRMFQASYSSGTMTGDVKSYAIDELTGGVTEAPLWSAVDELENDLDTYGHTGRIIATYSDVSYTGIPFRNTNISASGSTEQQNYLLPYWGDPVVATPENLINYLRGNETHEVKNGGPFRSRSKPLGDIVHSSPVHKDGVLYVGGNDGMLHAINAENGHELFAYVPNLVYENLKEFGNPDYQHKFFVDLTPFVKSGVTVSGVQKTLLMGGLGKGGKGYYCLDISDVSNDPCVITSENILANRVMWEYPNSGTTTSERDDLGYTYSKAFVVRSNDPTNAQWIVIFGNGYNSESSNAVLFILNPSDGSLLKRIDTQVGSCNGLSTPLLVDYDSDEKVDFIYAGDLKGNLWKFDLTSNNYNNWDVAYRSGTSPQPLFQAKGPGGATQRITTKPDAMFHCEKDGIMVVFATGMYLGGDDLLDTSTQTVYGIWDYQYEDIDDTEYLGSFDRGSTPLLSNQPLYDVSMLEQISIFEGYVDVGGVTSYLRVLSNNDPDWQTTTDPGDSSCGENTGTIPCDPNSAGSDPDPVNDAGWYFDFPTTGERVVSNLLIRLGNVVLISFTPSDSPCSVGGDSMVMEMDACTGGRLPYAQFDLNDDGVIDENDLIYIWDPVAGEWIQVAPTGRRYEGRLQPPVILRLPRTETEKKYFSSSGGVIEELTEKAARIGMIYWREHD